MTHTQEKHLLRVLMTNTRLVTTTLLFFQRSMLQVLLSHSSFSLLTGFVEMPRRFISSSNSLLAWKN